MALRGVCALKKLIGWFSKVIPGSLRGEGAEGGDELVLREGAHRERLDAERADIDDEAHRLLLRGHLEVDDRVVRALREVARGISARLPPPLLPQRTAL